MSDLVERLRAKVFAGPAEDQRLKLVAEEAADKLEAMQAALEEINATIYAKGAPLGSTEYFRIRELAALNLSREKSDGSIS